MDPKTIKFYSCDLETDVITEMEMDEDAYNAWIASVEEADQRCQEACEEEDREERRKRTLVRDDE